MNDVFKVFLSLSLSGSLLILILFLSRPFMKSKLSRQWQYYVWLIVIARLLLPFAPVGSFMDKTFKAIGHTYYSEKIQLAQSNPTEHDILIPESSEVTSNLTENLGSARNVSSHHPIQEAFRLLVGNYWLIWLSVAAIMLIRKITIYRDFVRYIKAGTQPVSNIELLDRVAVIGEQNYVSKAVELCVNPLVSSPVLIGFFRPCIVIPSTNLSDKDFHYIVLHEMTHYRRRDMFYKWLVQVTICLHWFNPLVYLMGGEINRACEFACDETILTKLGSDKAQDYGNTLLEAMASVGQYKEALASVTLSENKKLLKERLEAIMNFRIHSKFTTVFSIILTVAMLCGATFTGAYAATVNTATSNNTVGSKAFNKEVFNLADGFHTAGGGYSSGGEFTLENDAMIQISVNIKTLTGKLDFCIQRLDDDNWYSSNILIDKHTGKPKEKLYETSGGNVDETDTVFLKAGKYNASITGTGYIQNASWKILGTIVIGATDKQSVSDNDTDYETVGGKNVAELTIDVNSANIIVNVSEDKNFHFDYDTDSFNVQTTGSDTVKTITVTAKDKANENYPSFVNIQIPNNAYKQLTYRGNSAGLNLPAIDANIKVDVSTGSCSILIPAGYSKTCDFSLDTGSGGVIFEKGVADYTFSLDATGSAPVLPSGWPVYRYGQNYNHQEGNGTGKINVTVDTGSFVVQNEIM